MSSVDDILTILFSYSAGYKRLRQLTYGGERIPRPQGRKQSNKISEHTLRSTLSRLRRNGLIERRGDVWVITPEGKGFYKKRKALQKRKEFMRLNR